MPYQAYNCHVYSAATLWAFRVFQAPLDVSDLDCLHFLSVFVTERPPFRDWGLLKFHIHVLIS
jgi:hypothetical protein